MFVRVTDVFRVFRDRTACLEAEERRSHSREKVSDASSSMGHSEIAIIRLFSWHLAVYSFLFRVPRERVCFKCDLARYK